MSKLVKAATEWLLSVEKICTRRGPAGGDGGRGGDVVLVVEEGLRTLMDFRFNRHFKATPGENGMSKGMHGRGSEDLLVKVPPGTTVRDAETGALIGDLIENGQTLVVAKADAVVAGIFALLPKKPCTRNCRKRRTGSRT